tara:strand:+ start:319 stop:495 length:177 start_codon:yes stop_codon:yes gene_type:complete
MSILTKIKLKLATIYLKLSVKVRLAAYNAFGHPSYAGKTSAGQKLGTFRKIQLDGTLH